MRTVSQKAQGGVGAQAGEPHVPKPKAKGMIFSSHCVFLDLEISQDKVKMEMRWKHFTFFPFLRTDFLCVYFIS